MEKYLGIDIGGTFIKYGVYTQDGIQLSSDKAQTKCSNLNEFINLLVDIINQNEDAGNIIKRGDRSLLLQRCYRCRF